MVVQGLDGWMVGRSIQGGGGATVLVSHSEIFREEMKIREVNGSHDQTAIFFLIFLYLLVYFVLFGVLCT